MSISTSLKFLIDLSMKIWRRAVHSARYENRSNCWVHSINQRRSLFSFIYVLTCVNIVWWPDRKCVISRNADISKFFSAFQKMKRADSRYGVSVVVIVGISAVRFVTRCIEEIHHRSYTHTASASDGTNEGSREKTKRTEVLAVVHFIVFCRFGFVAHVQN